MRTFKIFLLALILGLAFSFAKADILKASVSQKKLSVGESFNLLINAHSAQSNLKTPDLTPLQKNFTVLGVSQSQSLTIIDNKIVRSNQWIINLIPKKTGTIIVPSIYIGTNKTQPITIHIANLQTEIKNAKQTIFVEATITPKQPYVNSELIYHFRVFYDVNLSSAIIIPPHGKNILIQQDGEDRTYETIINGKKYQVYQRNFILIPQNAGELILSPAVFRGQLFDKSANPAFGQFYNLNVKPVEFITPSIKVNVKPIPKSFTNHWWLPASHIKFSEHWSQAINKVKVGDPITRTLTLTAEGALASQLPSIHANNTKLYNAYVSQPKSENFIINGHLFGKKQVKIVYIPTHAGNFILPAISVKWWNTHTQKVETATIPARTFSALAIGPLATIEKLNSTLSKNTNQATALSKTKNTDWLSLVIIFFIMSSVVIVISWRLFYKYKKSKFDHGRSSLKKACLRNDAISAKKALMVWACQHFNGHENFMNLNQVKQKISAPELIQEIELLQEILYGNSEKTWSGKNFWRLFKKQKFSKKKNSHCKNILPNLNPE